MNRTVFVVVLIAALGMACSSVSAMDLMRKLASGARSKAAAADAAGLDALDALSARDAASLRAKTVAACKAQPHSTQGAYYAWSADGLTELAGGAALKIGKILKDKTKAYTRYTKPVRAKMSGYAAFDCKYNSNPAQGSTLKCLDYCFDAIKGGLGIVHQNIVKAQYNVKFPKAAGYNEVYKGCGGNAPLACVQALKTAFVNTCGFTCTDAISLANQVGDGGQQSQQSDSQGEDDP